MEQLRHADRLATVGKLSSGIAHELGTSLNVVSGRAKMLVREQLSRDEVLENGRIIVEQSERIAHVIRQLLDFARRRSLKRGSTDLGLLAPLAEKARRWGRIMSAADPTCMSSKKSGQASRR
jgi:two-component system, NtrC family, sensor kinase